MTKTNQPPEWVYQSVFYHIYPMSFFNVPGPNDFTSAPVHRIEEFTHWINHLHRLEVNALYFGPIWESTSHGYDTADYYNVDRRLGDSFTARKVFREIKSRGMKVILDGVFNHVGRDFWAFRDLQQKGEESAYKDWFYKVDFSKPNQLGDSFSYQNWEGFDELVKLNLRNPEVKHHLFEAVKHWIVNLEIDGLRLDVAYDLDPTFIEELRAICTQANPDFWLMGEIIHAPYDQLVAGTRLHSCTNYECYKGIYSSFNDENFYEIAYSLNRLFGNNGMFRNELLYNFVDNHDVDRIASRLEKFRHIYPLYLMLFTIPGVASLYYGSEWGTAGARKGDDDRPLRPYLDPNKIPQRNQQSDLYGNIKKLIRTRRLNSALMKGDYQEIHVDHKTIAFQRQTRDQQILVVISAEDRPVKLDIWLGSGISGTAVDLLNEENSPIPIHEGSLTIKHVLPCWGHILEIRKESGN